MKENISHITELTRKDLQEIAAAVDPLPGFCIRIEKENGRLKIGIDQNALALAINGFIRNGGAQANAADCTSVPFDPPS